MTTLTLNAPAGGFGDWVFGRGSGDAFTGHTPVWEESASALVPSESIREVVEELDALLRECSRPDWDGYEGEVIDPLSWPFALRLLLSLPSDFPLPEVTPHPDGEIGFDWYGRAGALFSISFASDGRVFYAGRSGGSRFHGSEPWLGGLPQPILDGIRKACS